MEMAMMANHLAACTGMRIGEILGLKGSCVFETHIAVVGQWIQTCEYTKTKTRKNRDIPLPPQVIVELHLRNFSMKASQKSA
jgi:integrase